MKKIINSENVQYQPVLTEELVLDDKATVGSFNGITSDAVARAVAGASGDVPQVTENDNGKVLTAIYDEGGAAVEWGEAPSGIPDMTAADGKILGAVDVEGTMEAQWISKPVSNVTTTDKAFTVGVNGTGLPITVDCANASETTSTIQVEVAGVAGYNIMANSDAVFFAVPGLDLTNTITITFPEDLGNASASGSVLQTVAWYKGVPNAVTNLDMSLHLSPTNQDGNVLKAGTYTVTGFASGFFTPDGICLYYSGEGEAVTQIKADIAAAASSLTLSTTDSAVTGYTIKPSVLPASTVADSGKVLTVDAEGTPAWATAGGGGGGSSSSAFDTTFNLVNDGVTWRLSKDASYYIDLTGGAGVYAYRVVAEITDSSNPTEIDDLYNVTVRVGNASASETKALYLKSDTSGYPDDPTSLSFKTSGILDISSAQHVRGTNVYVGIIPAKTSSAAVTSFTGGSVTLYLAKLSTLSGGWQPES